MARFWPGRLPRTMVLAVAIWLACAAALSPVLAASQPAVPLPQIGKSDSTPPRPPDDPGKIADYVGRLDDRQARAVLLDTLSQRAPGQASGEHDNLGELAGEAGDLFQVAGARLVAVLAAAAASRNALAAVLHLLDLDSAPWAPMAASGVVVLAAGLLAELAMMAALSRFSPVVTLRSSKPGLTSSRWIAIRALGLGTFTVATTMTAEVVANPLPDGQQNLLASMGAALLLVRVADLLALGCMRLLLPRRSMAAHRDSPVSLRVSLAVVHGIAAFGATALGILLRADVPADFRLLVALVVWTGLILAMTSVLQRLHRLAGEPSAQVRREDGPLFAWLRLHWLGMALTACVLLWVFTLERALETGLTAIRSGVLTLVIVAYAIALIRLATMTLRRTGAVRGDDGELRSSPWAPALVRCARVFGSFAAAWAVARIWDIDVVAFASNRLGEAAVRAATSVVTVLLLAYMAWEVVKALVRGSAGSYAGETAPEDLSHLQPASRMQTFLPLVEKFLFAIVVVVAGLGIMRALGVDTGPLLAGAGIIGIAIGFGAQTLVRDIVSGIFFLFDDAFRLGEYVEIDQTRGTVEGISIRSLRIRHHRGAVHTVPFGTITRLTNYSRDWIILKLEFLLAFDTDLAKVKKIVKEIGKELIDDPEYGPHFLEPVKSQGVRRMEQIGMVVGVKFMAKPGEQFILRREVYQRVRDAFEKNGIAFARPQVVVQVPSAGAPLTPDEERAVTTAAAAATHAAHPHELKPRARRGEAS